MTNKPKPTLRDVVNGTPEGQAAVQNAMEQSAEVMEGVSQEAKREERPEGFRVISDGDYEIQLGGSYAEKHNADDVESLKREAR